MKPDELRVKALDFKARTNIDPKYALLGHKEYIALIENIPELDYKQSASLPGQKVHGMELVRVAKESFVAFCGEVER